MPVVLLPSATRRACRALAVPALALGAAFLTACATPEPETPPAATQVAAAAEPGASPAFHGMATPVAQRDTVTVYKSPTCGCCANWVDHMREHGYTVVVNDLEDVQPVKTREGVTDALSSCHTATVGGYVVEGHVPAADVQRLLSERPAITGIAVPGMPMGSPGMEGGRVDRYDVVAFDKAAGTTRVFASH
jgi:hypothetical protein